MLITLWMKLYKLFFHLLDTDLPTPQGPNEKVITDIEKRERKIWLISLQKEMREQSLSAFLLLAWMKAQKYPQMEHEYDVKYSYFIVSI